MRRFFRSDKVDDNKYQNLCAKIIFWSFLSQMMFTLSKRLFDPVPYSTVIAAAISFPYLVVLFIKLAATKKFRFNKWMVFAIFLVSALYGISFLNGVPRDKILLYLPQSIYGIILLSLAYDIKNLNTLYDWFAKDSIFISLISILIIFVDKGSYAYNMHFSYILSLAMFFHVLEFVRHKKKINLLVAIMDLLLIILYGSRGPILCLIVFMALYFILGSKKTITKILFCIIAALLALNVEPLTLSFRNLMDGMGLKSRTISLLDQGVGYVSGRDVVADEAVDLIQDNKIFGLGIAGEFRYMENYPHNLVLDLLIHWGVILGVLMLIYLFYLVARAILISHDKSRFLMIVFVSYGLVTLFFSGTYLTYDGFFILLGLSYNILQNYRRRRKCLTA